VRVRSTVDRLREERRVTVHNWLVGDGVVVGFVCCCEKSERKHECEVMKGNVY